MYFFRIFFLSICAFFYLTQTVSAATVLQFAPHEVHVKEGEKFTLVVEAIPTGDKNYTVRMSAEFPPEFLSVFSWSYNDAWMPLRKTGYDALDNDAGFLMKTAGFPDGFTTKTSFGTITFIAKKSGTAFVRVGTESLILNDKNVNVAALGQATNVIIDSAVIPPVGAPVVKPAPLIVPKGVKKVSPEISSSLSPTNTVPSVAAVTSSFEKVLSPTTSPELSTSSESLENPLLLKLDLNSSKVEDISDLVAVATLQNKSGKMINFLFEQSILDQKGNRVYSKKWEGTIDEEKIKILEFKDLTLPKGNYSLYISVSQDGKSFDHNGKSFSIEPKFFKNSFSFLGVIVSISLLLSFAILIRVSLYIRSKKQIASKILK